MNETDKLIEEQIKKLPETLRLAIDSVPWKTLVQEIGRANSLDTGQIVSLEQETMFILFGFENSNDYVSNVAGNVGISEDASYTIAESVVDKIFTPISEKSKGHENPTTSAIVPEIAPNNLPMVEEGEVAHTVPHVEQPETKSEPVKVSLPDYRYTEGKDPYREQMK